MPYIGYRYFVPYVVHIISHSSTIILITFINSKLFLTKAEVKRGVWDSSYYTSIMNSTKWGVEVIITLRGVDWDQSCMGLQWTNRALLSVSVQNKKDSP